MLRMRRIFLGMETCPHGARIVCVVGEAVRFLDDCIECAQILQDLDVVSHAVQRETVPA